MPDLKTGTLETEGLTKAQHARRERILVAAAELASQGGYDAVQMRDVAELAEVALGTLYRYFPSKVHLLVAAMNQQTEALRDGIFRRPPSGDTAHERVMNVMRRASRALERDPTMLGAMLRALMFADSSAAHEVESVNGVMMRLITWAITGSDEEPTAEERAISRVLQQVWFSSMLTWLAGRSSSSDLHENLDVASGLLLRDRP